MELRRLKTKPRGESGEIPIDTDHTNAPPHLPTPLASLLHSSPHSTSAHMASRQGDLDGRLKAHTGPSFPSNAISELFFWPMGHLLPLSYRRKIEHNDLYKLTNRNATELVWKRFEPHWNKQLEQATATNAKRAASSSSGKSSSSSPTVQKKAKPSLLKAVLRTFAFDTCLIVLLWLAWAGLQYATPLIMPYIAAYFAYKTLPLWWGFVYMTCLFAANFLAIVMFQLAFYRSWMIGIQVRAVLVNLIYKKSLTASSLGSRGRVLNLVAADAQSLLDNFPSFMMGVAGPVQIAVTLGLLGRVIGVFTLIPLGILGTSFFFLYGAAVRMPWALTRMQEASDLRIKLTTEFISAIRIVKYYAWEKPFGAKIEEAREAELKALRTVAIINAFVLNALIILPSFAMGFTIFFYAIKHELGLGPIFQAIAYLTYLRYPFVFLSFTVSCGAQYLVSFGRITEFITSSDMDEASFDIDPKNKKKGMSITDGFFSWDFDTPLSSSSSSSSSLHAIASASSLSPVDTQSTSSNSSSSSSSSSSSTDEVARDISGEETKENLSSNSAGPAATLSNINIDVPLGKLVVVVGGVGSGKSSLATAFLKEMRQISGKVFVPSPIGYASQEPFLINTTIRDNITFGLDFDAVWYQKVIKACSLETDLDLFPASDMTEVAEKGSNLSGGQRQRINLARAMYSNRQLFVFDDPFSAVDAHVGQHMFHNVALPLRDMGRAVLLITNQLQFAPFADQIYVLDKGKMAQSGAYSDLIADPSGTFYQLALEYGLVHQQQQQSKQGVASSMNVSSKLKKSLELLKMSSELNTNLEEVGESILKRSAAAHKPSSHTDDALLTPEEIAERDEKNLKLGAVTEDESTGSMKSVSGEVYSFYLKSGGVGIVIFVLLISLIRMGFTVGQNVWLSRWSSPDHVKDMSKGARLGGYAALIVAEALSIFVFLLVMVFFWINASRNIHRTLIGTISHATTAFFDKTPLGRLLSRFAKDVGLIDGLLSLHLQYSYNLAVMIIAAFANMCVGSKYSTLVIAFAIFVYTFILFLYRRPAIQVQRLESASRGPIFTHIAETLEGLPTVRAYGMSQTFNTALINKVDANAVDFLALRKLNAWFGMTATQLVNLVCTGATLMLLLFRNYVPDAYDTGLAVSAIANAVAIGPLVGATANFFIEFESRMNAPERVLEFKEVDQERAYEIEATKPPAEWPAHGKIEFKDLTIAYKPGVPVLHGLTASIKAMEKIGIVGRTGAGKSTLITALFRTTEPASGSVEIDGVDIDQIGLFDLRRRLSIIPQVPQLFIGTVRYNLDPFGEHSDEEIWKVLDMVSLKPFVANSLEAGLDSMVEENGGNFSVGQRQLLSMARCLLLDSHILLLDEATASLDVQSDAMLQRMIRQHFKQRTVLTIAHRLVTIIDCDRVMVLDKGRIVEFDSPKKLLQNQKGIFYGMVQATGKATASHLIDIANGAAKVLDMLEEDAGLLEESSIEDDDIEEIPVAPRKKSSKSSKKHKKASE